MVSARALALLAAAILLGAEAHAAHAQVGGADSTAALDPAQEDALEDAGGETGLVLEDEGGRAFAASPRAAWATRGHWRVADGAQALALSLRAPRGRLALSALLAREPGEARFFDDHAARVTWRPSDALQVSLGRIAPDAGFGLVLGPPAVGTRAPGAPVRRPALAEVALPSASPARAATGFDGAWLLARRGGWCIGVLAAATRRDARRVGEAWLPVGGVRHRTAREDSARAALGERALGLALARGPAWLVVAAARADPHRVAPAGATAAEQRAAPVARETFGVELGGCAAPAAWNGGGRLAGAAAFDAHGRVRLEGIAEFAPRGGATRATIVFENEGAAFIPLRARPERRAHSHVGVRLRGRLGGPPRRGAGEWAWRLEAHAVERRAFEPVRLWASLRANAPGDGWLEVRRDAEPARMLVAFRCPAYDGRLSLAGEMRFDRHGLARELWRVRAAGPVPGGCVLAGEASLAAGRSAFGWLDAEVPGGAWVASGTASERVRLECARPGGRVTPRLAWLTTRTAAGPRSEARLALEWGADNPKSPEEEPGR